MKEIEYVEVITRSTGRATRSVAPAINDSVLAMRERGFDLVDTLYTAAATTGEFGVVTVETRALLRYERDLEEIGRPS